MDFDEVLVFLVNSHVVPCLTLNFKSFAFLADPVVYWDGPRSPNAICSSISISDISTISMHFGSDRRVIILLYGNHGPFRVSLVFAL